MSRPSLSGQRRREAELAGLLQELFSVEELYRLVAHEFGDEVHASVAWDRARAMVVFDVARRLRQRGHVPQLLEVLQRERPGKRDDIDAVAALWAMPGGNSPPSEDRRVTRGLWVAGALLLSVAGAGAIASEWPAPHEPAKNITPLDPSASASASPEASSEAEAEEVPATAPATTEEPTRKPATKPYGDRSDCCAFCSATSKPCRNTCIPRTRECHYGPGCACS
jgi:hypothetical protein